MRPKGKLEIIKVVIISLTLLLLISHAQAIPIRKIKKIVNNINIKEGEPTTIRLNYFTVTIYITDTPPENATIIIGAGLNGDYWIVIELSNGLIIAIDPREAVSPSLPG